MAELKEEFKDVQVACLCFDGGQQWGQPAIRNRGQGTQARLNHEKESFRVGSMVFPGKRAVGCPQTARPSDPSAA